MKENKIIDFYQMEHINMILLEKWYKDILTKSFNIKASMRIITKWYEDTERYLPKWVDLVNEIEKFNTLYTSDNIYNLTLEDSCLKQYYIKFIEEIFCDEDKAVKFIEHSCKWTWLRDEIEREIEYYKY